MFKYLIFSIFLLNCNASYAQSYYPYQDIKLVKPSDYKDAEPMALSASTYALSTPYKKDDTDKERAMKFLVSWMSGTKEYHFTLQDVGQIIMDNHDLFSIYNAALAKFSIENKAASVNPKLSRLSAYKLVLIYCDNPANNFKLKKKERKELESN